MPKVTFKQADQTETELAGHVGMSVMTLAQQNGIDGIVGECGGSCACATCHVYVDPEYLATMPEMDELEADMLEGAAGELRPGSRLSCQILLTEHMDGLRVELPKDQLL